jgi:plastocyanin
MRRSMLLPLVPLMIAIVALAGCSSSSSSSSPATGGSSSASETGKITIGSDQANDHGTKDVTGKSTFEIEADNDDEGFYFDPTILTGSAGQSVTLEVKNEGSVPHTFTIDSLNVSVTVDPDSSKMVDVTFPGSGTVEFYCQFHRSQGMAGELEVA